MATYNKRGYKAKKEKIKDTADDPNLEENSTTAEVFNTLDETASRTEDFVASNQKYIFIVIGIVAALVLGYPGYRKFIKEPAQAEAMNEMYHAQKQYNEAVNGVANDSLYNLVLKGSEGKYGMLDIIENYSGTEAANLANYYAGVAYLNLKDYKNAITHLDQYSSEDEATGPMAKGAIGDAFVQLDQKEEALKYYVKAAKMRDNELTAPTYYYKAGVIALELGNASEALGYFNTIKENYPDVIEASQVDVFIAKAEAMSNK
ncbi:tetratricopeptide repeat protein [Lacinutrix neustonica]|uniref:Tetratricopeptide repeat protein n=1 Tax=Lacinutrix neustonica TaxID=2980107 RepID=A0A9E8MX69_9FLAO|nr:tetratricopeptide repeat protein [Lacinutrix neustonica]WAC03298.1 tetratricopeptide repeat protein [Lacinutrix neustonica]